MWLALNRTRIGMIVRAGVDDRDMLSAMGVPIQLVFVVVFAFGAGLAGMAGVVGGTFQSLSPGEDTRFLLASLIVVIVGGMGSITGRGARRAHHRPRRADRARLFPDLRDRPHLPDHGARAGRAAAGPAGGQVRPWRSPTARPRRAASAGEPTAAWFSGIDPAAVLVAVVLVIMPAIASDFVLVQIFALVATSSASIALSLMFLAGYGGMVSLAQMTIAGFAGYMVAIFGVNGAPGSIGWPWWLAMPMALVLAMIFGAIVGALAVRTEGIYTIMITLAIAAAFFYFTNENYAIFNGHTGINAIPTPQFLGRRLARVDPVLLS